MASDAPVFGSKVHLAREELVTEELLHRALEMGGLSLVYQPILRTADQGLESVEALMRCQVNDMHIPPWPFHPGRGEDRSHLPARRMGTAHRLPLCQPAQFR